MAPAAFRAANTNKSLQIIIENSKITFEIKSSFLENDFIEISCRRKPTLPLIATLCVVCCCHCCQLCHCCWPFLFISLLKQIFWNDLSFTSLHELDWKNHFWWPVYWKRFSNYDTPNNKCSGIGRIKFPPKTESNLFIQVFSLVLLYKTVNQWKNS